MSRESGPPTRSRHALITGGAGFIGSHLAEALLARNYAVTAIDDLSTGRLENIDHLSHDSRFRFVKETVTNEMVIDRLVSESDVVFHLAAAVGVYLIVSDPVHTIETNVLGTHSVLTAANRHRKSVLIASSSEIYGKSTQIPFREDDDRLLGPTTKSRWSYSTSKAVDEFLGLAYHRQMGLPVVVFRLFNTVGPRQAGRYGMVVPRFVKQALQGEPLTVYGDGQQTRCFCDVKDVIRAIVGLGECPEAVGHVFNIGSTNEVTILRLAKEVLGVVDEIGHGPAAGKGSSQRRADARDDRIVLVPYDEAYEAGFEDMLRRVPATEKIKETIGWQPELTLADTLRRIVESHSRDRGQMADGA